MRGDNASAAYQQDRLSVSAGSADCESRSAGDNIVSSGVLAVVIVVLLLGVRYEWRLQCFVDFDPRRSSFRPTTDGATERRQGFWRFDRVRASRFHTHSLRRPFQRRLALGGREAQGQNPPVRAATTSSSLVRVLDHESRRSSGIEAVSNRPESQVVVSDVHLAVEHGLAHAGPFLRGPNPARGPVPDSTALGLENDSLPSTVVLSVPSSLLGDGRPRNYYARYARSRYPVREPEDEHFILPHFVFLSCHLPVFPSSFLHFHGPRHISQQRVKSLVSAYMKYIP